MQSDWDALSFHSIERTKERQNIKSIKKACRNIHLAIKRGKSADMFKGWEQRYLKQQAREGYKAIAYNGFCYIFSIDTNRCITVYQLPDWFDKKHPTHPDPFNDKIEDKDNEAKYRKPNRRNKGSA